MLAVLVAAAVAIPAQHSATGGAWAGAGWQDASSIGSYDPRSYQGSLYNVVQQIGTPYYWDRGYDGSGIDVAVIDTGVVPVNGLTAPGKVVDGADLSFESQDPDLRHLDGYGHGTHLAGIIAGRDDQAPANPLLRDAQIHFVGVAPGARIVNVRVADHEGAVDVSQVIAAIDWVVQHRNENGFNIRVLNLSYGTDSAQDPRLDPLVYAVERAWRAGIVVVVAAGNDGNGARLGNPALSPYVIAVGAVDGLHLTGANAQPIPDWASCGDRTRGVDLVAPGGSIVSLRNPGSHADTRYPQARVAERFFLGSGTSQAAAVVSGAIALVLDHRPSLSPDAVKGVLTGSAKPLRKVSTQCQGAGLLDLYSAWWQAPPTRGQSHVWSTGLGTLEGARGSEHLTHDGVTLSGEQDIFGRPFNTAVWAPLAAAGASWSGGTWNGSTWTGTSWSATSWSGTSWSGTSWSGTSWSGTSWSGVSWSGMSWSGTSWSGTSWSGTSWSGTSWSGTSWSCAGGAPRGQSWD
jgi:serine protease AprX